MNRLKQILVTGGAGYVGSVLVPKLLHAGFRARVLDLFLFGDSVLDSVKTDPNLDVVRGDIRDVELVQSAMRGCDAVIHLACLSNDPSFELDPELGKSINYDSFRPMVEAARDNGVRRFVYASSSSVYGVKQETRVTEAISLEPLTDYSKYKALCEQVLTEYQSPDFTTVVVRPATVCGYSPRLRLDLTVNILTNHAVNTDRIRVFGGSQYRPNIHIDDMTDLYVQLVQLPKKRIAGKIWNAGCQNLQVREIADLVRHEVGGAVQIVTEPTNDLRSYRVCSERIFEDIGFSANRTVGDAAHDLVSMFRAGKIPNPLDDDRYYNIRTMQARRLK